MFTKPNLAEVLTATAGAAATDESTQHCVRSGLRGWEACSRYCPDLS